MSSPLEHFLNPKSIAIVGASKTLGRPGYTIIENLIKWGVRGKVYPINPKGGEILGLKVYKSMGEIPEEVEAVFSLASPEEAPEVIEDSACKGAKALMIGASGFSDAGDDGAKLERSITKLAHKRGIRIIGPNTVGVLNISQNVAPLFYPMEELRRGQAAFVTQSGQFTCPIVEMMFSRLRLGLSWSIDLGNKCDIDESDALEYCENDPEIKVLGLYMEGVKDSRRFIDTARRVSQKKPVVVFKTGRTASGAKATLSHTGSMAVNDVIFDAAIKQAGLIRAKDLEEFLDLIKAFGYLSLPKGNRVGITSCSGGAGAMAADACEDYGLRLANFCESTNRRIAELSSSIKVSNLIDLFAFGAPKEPSLLLHEGVIKALMLDANVDSILMCLLTAKQAWLPDLQTSSITKIEQVKPIAAWVTGVEKTVMKITEFLEEGGIPVFPSPERAVRALGGLYKYYQQVTKDT